MDIRQIGKNRIWEYLLEKRGEKIAGNIAGILLKIGALKVR
jgi:hypothetical protein